MSLRLGRAFGRLEGNRGSGAYDELMEWMDDEGVVRAVAEPSGCETVALMDSVILVKVLMPLCQISSSV